MMLSPVFVPVSVSVLVPSAIVTLPVSTSGAEPLASSPPPPFEPESRISRLVE
jgi:hypothetical protein